MNLEALRKPLSFSPFLTRLDARYPDWLPGLEAQGRLNADLPPAKRVLDETIREAGLDSGLRQFRNREMLRITWRELAGVAPLTETMHDLSRLAELCLEAAIAAHHRDLTERFGTPRCPEGTPQHLVVFGLGKLGGQELNLSSDIDLILAFPSAGECDGKRGLSNEQFFIRLARLVISSLSELTGDGFCFRVDTRLRPFGEAGPLVCSFGALEQYYQREGRDWERYALVKARTVAGDLSAGEEFLQTLTPFVYRRYIDFGAVESLRTMLDAIRVDAARKQRTDDVKRGPGGIREVEFLVQCVQLLRGGRETALQTQSLLKALDTISDLELMPEDRILTLRESYDFLRRVENAIQAQNDQQTHTLPADEGLDRISAAMNFPNPEALHERLLEVRSTVTAALDDSFPRQEASEPEAKQWQAALQALSGEPAERFLTGLDRRALSDRGRQRLEQFMPLLLNALEGRDLEPTVLSDVLDLLLAISQRSAYLALLVQNPPALERMLDLFISSDWVARTVIRHPALLDELLDPSLGRTLPDRVTLSATVQRLTGRGIEEDRINALAYQKLAQSFRIAVAELDGTISSGAAEQKLTELAEVVLAALLDLSRDMLSRRHDAPDQEGLGIMGYGSLGAGDISYHSDLDLVFLYPDETPKQPTPGLARETWYTRQVRRLLAVTTTVTPAGRLYEVDTRLRPNGKSGLLVSPMAAFERYQLEKAWTWEQQALSRARPVAGNPAIGERFNTLRKQVLSRQREASDLVREVSDMRQRMREASRGKDELKHGPGGLLDIEFLAQLGVLTCAHEHGALAEATNTRQQLGLLGDCGWIPEADVQVLLETRRALKRARHENALYRYGCKKKPDCSASARICQRFGIGGTA